MENSFLFTISYKDFRLWDVKRYSKNAIKSHFEVSRLGHHINQENEKIELSDFPDKMFHILGISNEAGMFDAYSDKGVNFNQPYKVVNNGYIAYNPYRVNVGSIGIKTENLKGNLISPAYVVFSCKETLLPEFLFVLMKSSWFNDQVKENTSGSVRQNLTFDALSNIKIPVPSIDEQKRILLDFNKAQNIILQKEKYIRLCKDNIELLLFKHLGITKKQKLVHKNFLSLCNYSDIFYWGVDKNLNKIQEFFKVDNTCCTLSAKQNYINKAFRGKSPVYKNGTNSVVLNQKCNRWDEICEQYAKTVDEKWFEKIAPEFLLKENDIIVNSTGEGTIGRASLVSARFAGYFVDSHMLVLRVNRDYISPAFIVKQINSEFGQKQIELLKGAQATKQTELGIDNLLRIKFVLPFNEKGDPDINKQNSIVEEINNVEMDIRQISCDIKNLKEQANQDFENAIFTK